ncbi:phosphatidylinositol-specific phospholipase [Apodospora peruviana]|uniref:Phosphatidylinositol-specific phospholipase n=1 Tax=Apodospora peruviana TaxID=516989 RepID=A0AAE0M3T0_9PEZI|nr:phosphatidylinositol-specific phospholipase [Apodospora peruviana]
MSWTPHGTSDLGFVQTSSHGQSQTVPAVTSYRGRLWCMWPDLNGNIWYTYTALNNDAEFLPRIRFPQPGLPVLANLNGHLHAIIVLNTGGIAHYLLTEDESETKPDWICLGLVGASEGANAHASPSLVAFHSKLVLAFINAGALYWTIWNHESSTGDQASGTWSVPMPVTEIGEEFDGIPALFVIKDILHLLCATHSDAHEILSYSYGNADLHWARCDDVSEGRAARGVSATSYGDSAYLGFIENGPGNQTHDVYITSFTNGRWQQHEAVAGRSAADPPQIAILNGRIHCIFNDNTSTKDLRWYSRPVLDYSLSSWMANIAGDTLLSRITIPGTHDSCARSNIPFVRTQYLSITQQLALGIRFLDLRLRVHDDGQLYVYHGGVPIGLRRRLSFAAVMDEIWTFLRGSRTEAVLVSINNDNISPEQQANPAMFYDAVEAAIAATPPWSDGRHRWSVEPVTPRLDDVRGRAVLLRRYAGDPGIKPTARQGLDLSAWINDSPEFTITTPTNVRCHIQDKWNFTERMSLENLIATKHEFVRNLMIRAAGTGASTPAEVEEDDAWYIVDEEDDDAWYINFCSAVGDPVEHGEVAQAKWIAVGAHSGWYGGQWVEGINRITREFVQQQQQHNQDAGSGKRWNRGEYRLGIVNLDYPELPEDNDLVARLIEANF